MHGCTDLVSPCVDQHGAPDLLLCLVFEHEDVHVRPLVEGAQQLAGEVRVSHRHQGPGPEPELRALQVSLIHSRAKPCDFLWLWHCTAVSLPMAEACTAAPAAASEVLVGMDVILRSTGLTRSGCPAECGV